MAEVERHDGVIAENGAVYVFFSPLQLNANGEVDAADADRRLQSAFGDFDPWQPIPGDGAVTPSTSLSRWIISARTCCT